MASRHVDVPPRTRDGLTVTRTATVEHDHRPLAVCVVVPTILRPELVFRRFRGVAALLRGLLTVAVLLLTLRLEGRSLMSDVRMTDTP
jgi:hypothetical protein